VRGASSEASVRQFVRDWVSVHAKAAIGPIDGTANFVATGIIDSMTFVKLLMDTEREYQLELDFSQRDPQEFLSIDGFAVCVANCIEQAQRERIGSVV
jgi:acyl carrier protein